MPKPRSKPRPQKPREHYFPPLNEQQHRLAEKFLGQIRPTFEAISGKMNMKPWHRDRIRDDVLSNLNQRAHRIASRYAAKESRWETFVGACVRNEILDQMKKSRRLPATISHDEFDWRPAREPKKLRTAADSEQLELMRKAIERLGKKHKMILQQVISRKATSQEHASELGITAVAFNTRFLRARDALAKKLGVERPRQRMKTSQPA